MKGTKQYEIGYEHGLNNIKFMSHNKGKLYGTSEARIDYSEGYRAGELARKKIKELEEINVF